MERLSTTENIEIIGGIYPEQVFTRDNYKANTAKLSSVTFEGAILFESVNFSIGAKFEDCIFYDIFGLYNISAQGYDSTFEPNSNSITFLNCVFKGKFSIEGNKNKLERNLVFTNCTFEKGIEIQSLNIELNSVSFDKCTIKEGFHLNSIYAKNEIRINNCTVECFTTFFDIKCDDIVFLGSNIFSDNVNIKSCLLNNGIVFNDGVFKKDFCLYLIETKESGLNIINSYFEKSLKVYIHWDKKEPVIGINNYYLNGCKFNDGFDVIGTQNLLANKPIVENIQIVVSPDLKGNITFKDIDIGILSIGGFNAVANIKFEHVDINQIKMKGFINNSGFIFSGVRVSDTTWFTDGNRNLIRNSAIYIDETNFGKAQFFMTDFSSFGKVVFHNNIVIDISTSMVKWFSPEQLDDGNEKNYLNRLEQALGKNDQIAIRNAKMIIAHEYNRIKEIYRQLKIVAQRQGDMPLSLYYKSLEMNCYRKQINYKPDKDWNEVIILWSNQTNDFGQNWLKATGLFILFSFISYVPIALILNSVPLIDACCIYGGINLFENIENWIFIMNPVHRISDLNTSVNPIPKLIIFWDFLSRIIVSYFIFQIVSAFRKFNK
jgi:hypothetical protein